MNRIIALFVLSCLWISSIDAQTCYYKLTKEIRKGTPNTNVSGGQFITFEDDKCFESDKYGKSVGNGIMKYDKYYSSQFKTYIGTCYYGTNAFFRFNSDKSLLNIETNAGKIYVYRKSTAPSGVVTCSLIRKPSNSSESSSYVPNHPAQSTYNGGGYSGEANNGNGYVGGGNVGNNNENRKQKPIRHQCSLCNGTGKIVRESSIATFGNDTQVYCSVCGRSYFRSTGHSHVTCPTCHGKGYVEYRL